MPKYREHPKKRIVFYWSLFAAAVKKQQNKSYLVGENGAILNFFRIKVELEKKVNRNKTLFSLYVDILIFSSKVIKHDGSIAVSETTR